MALHQMISYEIARRYMILRYMTFDMSRHYMTCILRIQPVYVLQ